LCFWMRPGMPKWLCGTSCMSVSMASILDTANMLAMIPEMVAAIASPMVSHSPHRPTAGRAASARDESRAAMNANGNRPPASSATWPVSEKMPAPIMTPVPIAMEPRGVRLPS